MSRNKDLAAALTEKHGLAKADAEAFVSAMFTLINEALASERAVKVKGLGTFKVISVAARKSVDVNTGAPIVIDGRDKISFTPDSSLRDEVNKPFAQFETVVVNDGVDFSEIDRKFEKEETTENTEETGSTKDTENTEETGATKDTKDTEETGDTKDTEDTEETGATKDTKDTEETGATKDTKETEDTEATEETPEVTEDTPTVTEDTPEVVEETPEIAEETPEVKEETEVELEVTEDTEDTDNTRIVEEVKDEMRAVMKSEHRKMHIILAACVALFALCAIGGGYMFTLMQKKDNRISNLEAQVQSFAMHTKQQAAKPVAPAQQPAAQPAAQSHDSLQIETALAGTSPQNDKPSQETQHAGKMQQGDKKQQANKVTPTENSTATEAASTNYAKDPRIRTGAYNIVGIDKTVTVKAGQTLSSISHFYLGKGMECYVEAVNGGRTEFKAGEKIKIPKLKHKKLK